MYYEERKQADNPLTAASLLHSLASHRYPTVRVNLAGNPSATQAILSTLARDRDEWVRVRVAKNVCTPIDVLLQLSEDASYNVRQCVAKHPKASDAVLVKLMKPDVDNRNLSGKYREGADLEEGSDEENAWQLFQESCSHSFHATDEVEEIRFTILDRVTLSEPILRSLLSCGSVVLRRVLAKRQDLSCSFIKALLNDIDEEVRRSAITCPAFGAASALPNLFDCISDTLSLKKIAGISSKKEVCKLLFGTKHAEEVRFIFDNKSRSCWHKLKQVQCFFLNPRGKVNRHEYLRFLAFYNRSHVDFSRFFKHDPFTLTWLFNQVGWQEVLNFFDGQEQNLAADCVYLLHDIYLRPAAKATRCVVDLFDGGFSSHNAEELHDVLLDMQLALIHAESSVAQQMLWQQKLLPTLPHIVPLLPDGLTLFFPTCSSELSMIGRQQRHCVGMRIYQQRCIAGDSIIFSFEVNGCLKHGATFEFCGNTGELIQAAGFCNEEVSISHHVLAAKVFECLLGKLV